jgi:hypothetical protein
MLKPGPLKREISKFQATDKFFKSRAVRTTNQILQPKLE